MDSMKLNDKIVLDYIAPNGKLIPQRCIASVLKKNNFYDYIINRYNNNTLNLEDKHYLRECLYRLVNNIETPPVCKICGNALKFCYTKYPIYCSKYCSNHDEDVLKKISESCSKSLKDAYKRDGDNIKLKRQNTLSAKYGEDIKSSSPFAVREIQELSQKIVEEKYGVKNAFQMEKCRKKNIETVRKKSIQMQKERGIEIEYLENGNYLVKNCCPIHGDLEYTQTDFNNRFRLDRYHISNPCYLCNPFGYHISGQQKNIVDYIKSIYSGNIIEGSGLNQSAFAILGDFGLRTSFNFGKFFISREPNFHLGLSFMDLGLAFENEGIDIVRPYPYQMWVDDVKDLVDGISEDYNLIFINGPSTDYNAEEIDKIEKYLAAGNNMHIYINRKDF